MGSILKKRKRDEESKSPRKRFKAALVPKRSVFSHTEKKSVDLPATTLEFNNAGPKTLLNGTIPGNALQNRLGRKIRMNSLHIQGHIVATPLVAVAALDEFAHIYVVYDSQPNGAAFALADLLQSTDNAGTQTTSTYSFVNLSNSERFKILRHEYLKFEAPGDIRVQNPSDDLTDYHKKVTVNMFIKMKDMPVQYNVGTAGTVADIQTGSLYLMVLSNATTATTATRYLNFATRVRFTDL